MNVKATVFVIAAMSMVFHRVDAQSRPGWHRLWSVDPLHADPARLDQPLHLLVPPDLSGDAGVSASEAVTLDLDCATREGASRPDNAQWALQALRANGAGSAAPVLDFPLAIRLAVCHNPELRVSWSQIAQQSAQVGQSKSAYLPRLAANISLQRSRIGYADANAVAKIEMVSQNIAFNWRLWDFGARGARVEAAQAQLQAALGNQNATLQKVIGDVLYAYADAQAAQARLVTQRRLLLLADRNLLAAQRRQAGGASSVNDTLQARTVQARIQLDQIRAEGDLAKARARVVYQMGLPPGAVFDLIPLPDATREITGDLGARPAGETGGDEQVAPLSEITARLLGRALDDWLENARQNHPAIVAARAQSAAAEAALQAVRADGLPTVDFSLGHYRDGRPNQQLSTQHSRENVIGISLDVPLFDGFANRYEVRAAQAVVEQKEIELQATEQQTLMELVQLHTEAHASLGNLRAAANLYRAADVASQSAQRQYEHGALDILQLNQSLAALQQAQDDLMRIQLEWSRARLKLWLTEMLRS